jgi:hypothetical protein
VKLSIPLFRSKKNSLFLGLFLLLIIVFESYQQLWYINTFDLSSGVSILELLPRHLLSWSVWLLFLFVLIYYSASQNQIKERMSLQKLLAYLGIISFLVLICVLMAAALHLLLNTGGFSFQLYRQEFIPFFFFQKAPLYTFAYIAFAVILEMSYHSEDLEVRVQKLSEIQNDSSSPDLQNLKENNAEQSAILSVKVGNKHRLIPVANILWIEADDYCVKIHAENSISYSMRISMKALEERLQGNFLRVHRTAIVNMDQAKTVVTQQTPRVILHSGNEIPIARRKLVQVKKYLA